jgi:hypothetical protein
MQTLKDSPTAFCPPGNSDEYLDLIGSALVILQMVFHLLCIVQIFLICMLLLLLFYCSPQFPLIHMLSRYDISNV